MVKSVAIILAEGASKRLALFDCARSIKQGYGAGTLSHDDNGAITYLGFWTSCPETYTPEETHILVDAGREVSDMEMYTIVYNRARECE